MEKVAIQGVKVTCHNKDCGHTWLYTKGKPQYRIRCPKCHSSKNNVNAETFGKWTPFENKLLERSVRKAGTPTKRKRH